MENNKQTFPSNEEFVEKYRNMHQDEEKTNEHYVCDISELEKPVSEDDVDSLKKLNRLIDYHCEVGNNVTVRGYDDSSIKSSNLVILACKHNKVKTLEYLLSDDCKILNNLSKCMHKPIISPFDEDETCHNAFYYAIRSGNVELLNLLINKWPDNYFNTYRDELDKILSVTFEELKLKNLLLSREVEMFVQKKLLEVRFFSDVSESDETFSSDVNNIKERIQIVLDSIEDLVKEYSDNRKVDPKFLFIVKFIVQNMHILKWQLKSTYDRLPWEEIQFCLVCFLSFHVKESEMNIFYQSLLNESKIISYLKQFSEKLAEEKYTISENDKLSALPRLKREEIVKNIISSCPQFESLYEDYQEMRDIYSLDRINNYIHLATSADVNNREGHLVVTRTLQIIGENIKNTLDSPNLSNNKSEILLLSLGKNTKQVIVRIRDSLSHAKSLLKRKEIEEEIKFFHSIQNDLKKVGQVIADILYKNKIKLVKKYLEKIVSSKNVHEVREAIKILNNASIVKMHTEIFRTTEDRKLRIYVKELYDKISDKTIYEEAMFNKINEIINLKSIKFKNMSDDFYFGFSALKTLNKIVCERGTDDLKAIKFFAHKALDNIIHQLDCCNIGDVVTLTKNIFDSIGLRMENQHDKFNEIEKLVYKIIHIVRFSVEDIKWIEILREKLHKKSYFSSLDKNNYITEEHYNKELELKICELKSVLRNNKLENELIEKFPVYMNNKILQAVLEMLVLDILSILSSLKGCVENNTFFLDEYTPLLTGKSLRNHLAHDNALLNVIYSNPPVAIITVAKLLTETVITGGEKKLGKLAKDDPVNVRNKYNHSLAIIDNQIKMFCALENGNVESLRTCINKGADIYARDNNLWSSFHFASKGGSVKVLKFMYDQNYDLVPKDVNGQSPFHIAAANGRKDFLKLCKNGKKISELVDNGGKTALHVAAQNGHKDVVKVLLNNNACKNIYDNSRRLPIHYAVVKNYVSVANVLLMDEFGEIDDLGLLYLAAECGHLQMINLLLENNANVNERFELLVVPLHAAAFHGHLDVVNTLISKEAIVDATDLIGLTPLFYAVLHGHYNIVESLLKYGASVNVFDSICRYKPLHHAAKNGHERIVEILLKNKANANDKVSDGMTPLHFAAECNSKEIAELLIKNNANINAVDNNNSTPLHYSASKDYFELVKLLIENNADVNAEDASGITSLHLAAKEGHRNIVDLLIKNQADVNAKTHKGNTPLHAAALKGHESIASLLIEKKADVNSANYDGVTPLFSAIMGGNINIFNILIKNNARIDLKSKTGDTPLHVAAIMGNKEMVEYLIRVADINLKNNSNRTPFVESVICGHKDIVQKFLAIGANVNEDSGLPLLAAAYNGYTDIVNVLLKIKNIDVNLKHKYMTALQFAVRRANTEIVSALVNHKKININVLCFGKTALHEAAFYGFDEIVKILIKAKANVNACSEYGSALHLAVMNSHNNVVKVLLDSGADVNIADKDGKTALVIAVMNDNLSAVKLLLKCEGIDINSKEYENVTVLHIASARGNLNMVEYLTKKGSDINASESGKKPIHIAMIRGFMHIVEFFLSKGVSTEYCHSANETLLHYAATKDNLEWVKCLITQNTDVNAVCDNGSTPLHFAAEFSSKEVVEVFINSGAIYNASNKSKKKPSDIANDRNLITFVSTNKLFDCVINNNGLEIEEHVSAGACVNAKDANFGTLLHFASWKGYNKVVEILLQHRADPNVTDKNGFTPLHLAAKDSHFEVVMTLLKNGAIYNSACNDGKTPSDLSTNKNIIELFKLVNDAFENVKNDNPRVIHDINVQHVNTAEAIMCSRSKQNETLLVFAVRNNFSNIKELKEVLQGNVSKQIEKSLWLFDMGKYQESVSNLNCIFEKRLKIFGLDNSGTLDILYHIAKVLVKQGVYEQSLSILKEVFNKRKEILGPDNKDTLCTRCLIAVICHKRGEYEEAHNIYKEIYEKQREILEPNHPDGLLTQFYMALSLDGKGEHEEALRYTEEVYRKWKETLGDNNYNTMIVECNKAKILNNLGRNEEALTISQNVYGRQIIILGVNHPDTLLTLHNIAAILASQRKYDEALEKFEEVLSLQRKVLGENHPDTVLSECKMASVGFARFSHTVAYNALRKCYDKRDVLGLNHPVIKYIDNILQHINSKFFREGYSLKKLLSENLLNNLRNAAITGDIPLVQYLLKCGADINSRDSNGRLVLHYATYKGHMGVVNVLLKNGTDVTQVTNKGNTALHTAADKGHKDIVEVLLQHVSNDKLYDFINAMTTSCGKTALHVAAENGSVEIVKCLLKHGAVYNIRNKEGKTPMDLTKDQYVKNFLKLIKDLFECVKNNKLEFISKLYTIKPNEFLVLINSRNIERSSLWEVAGGNINSRNELLETSFVGSVHEFYDKYILGLKKINKEANESILRDHVNKLYKLNLKK